MSAMDNIACVEVSDGESGTIYVRAVRTIDSVEYYSDWVSLDYNIPVVNLGDVEYYTAFSLDYNRLIDWADYNGYEYVVSEEIYYEEKYFVVDVSCKDSLNSGFWNAIGRALGSSALWCFFKDGAAHRPVAIKDNRQKACITHA